MTPEPVLVPAGGAFDVVPAFWGLRRRVGVWLRVLVEIVRRGRAATPACRAR
jgi:hypothetical protein